MCFMSDVADRPATRVRLTASGHKAYIEAIEGAFGADADCAIPIEIHGFLKTLLKMRVYEKLETGGIKGKRALETHSD